MNRNGIGSHTKTGRGETDNWITPGWLLERLGGFDLDPCPCDGQPWPTALRHLEGDGLAQPWEGRVWLNPPYGPQLGRWLAKLADHGDGIALVFARTETRAFFDAVWGRASGLLFLRGRLHFCRPDGTRAAGNAGGPSVLIAYGRENAAALRLSGIDGAYVGPQIVTAPGL